MSFAVEQRAQRCVEQDCRCIQDCCQDSAQDWTLHLHSSAPLPCLSESHWDVEVILYDLRMRNSMLNTTLCRSLQEAVDSLTQHLNV